MSRRLHNFPQSYKGQSQFNRFIDFVSGGLLLLGGLIWIFLSSTIGQFIPIAAHAIGFLLTASMYLLYSIRVPADYYNKLGNERVYKLLYSSMIHKRKRYVYTKSARGEK